MFSFYHLRAEMSEMRRGIIARMFLSFWRPASAATAGNLFQLNARRGDVTRVQFWVPRETAVIICDMWDDHWCKLAAQRCSELAPRVNNFARSARTQGALIIHAPSNTMSFYSDSAQRKRAEGAPTVLPPVPIKMRL